MSSAGEMLVRIIEQANAKEKQCIRLDYSAGESGMRLDCRHPEDELITFEGRKILAMDPYTAENCARQVLDWEEGHFFFSGLSLSRA